MRPRRRADVARVVFVAIVTVVAIASTWLGGQASAASAAREQKPEQFTPLVMQVPTTPSWFTGTDGKVHLTYEVELLNAFPVDVTVTKLEVRDARTHRAIQTLTGADLDRTMSLLTSGTKPTATVPSAATGMAWMDIPLARPSDVPAAVEHVATITVPPGLPVPGTIEEQGGHRRVDRRAPVVLAPPLEGAGWLAVGSCCNGPHRRSIQPIDGKLWLGQRFAIDFNRLDDGNHLATGDPSRNASWPTYGQPVFAVADATVVQAVDEYDDQVPGTTEGITIENADGNHVILDLGGGRYAFYAHLRPGTVKVKAGDHVKRYDVIAETGNSGSSTGPHLHFHVMDAPSALRSNGMPYVFDRFTLDGTGPPVDELVALDPVATPVPISTGPNDGPRRHELVLGEDLVTFPTRTG